MKWIVRAAVSLLPLSAALSVSDGAAAASIPAVPKVQNADADGFPVLPEVASLFVDVSRTVLGLQHEASTLQEELHNVEQRSHAKMKKQKAAYDQLLKKQEQANQKVQGQNAQRAKAMMKLRDAARKTQAEIKKEEGVNRKQRLKLKALQTQLEQATKATEDALGVSEDTKPTHAQTSRQAMVGEDDSSSDETSSGSVADAIVVEEEPPRKSLSFLEIGRADSVFAAGAPNFHSRSLLEDEEDDYGSDEATQTKPALKMAVSSLSKASKKSPQASKTAVKQAVSPQSLQNDPAAALHISQDYRAKVLGEHSDPKTQPIKSSSASKNAMEKAVAAVAAKHPAAKSQPAKSLRAKAAEPSSAMRKIVPGPRANQHAGPGHATSSAAKASLETNTMSSKAEEAPSDEQQEQQLIEEAGGVTEIDKAHESLMPSSDEQTQVLHEGASSSEGMVATLSQGVKHIEVEVQRSEANLKLHFQKSYKAGKKRHAALVKQSEALDKNLHSMQLQENRLETTLAKVQATDKTLKTKIRAIGGILNRAVSPIASKQIE